MPFQFKPAAVILSFGFVLFAFFLVLQADQVISLCPTYDDAYNATVSKSIAQGNGYGTTRYGRTVLFNPEITTGPTLIVPGALFIKLFGNQYWVPNFTAALVTTLLLSLLLFAARRLFPRPTVYGLFMVLFLWALLTYAYSSSFYGFMGEMTAFLLVALGITVASRLHPRSIHAYAAGLFLGFGYLTKSLIAFGLFSFFLFSLIVWLISKRPQQLKHVLKILAAFLLVILCYQFFQLVAVGSFSAWSALKQQERVFFKNQGSGFSAWSTAHRDGKLARLIGHNVRTRALTLVKRFGLIPTLGWFILSAALLAYAIVHIFRVRRDRAGPWFCGAVFITASAIQLIWWLAFRQFGYYRHLETGVAFGLLGAAILVGSLFQESPRSRGWPVVLAILALLALKLPVLKTELASIDFKPSERIACLQSTARFIETQLTPNDIVLGSGWWANPDLDYILPTLSRFNDYWQEKQKGEQAGIRYIVAHSEFWVWDASQAAMKQQCERSPLFSCGPFTLCEYLPAPPDPVTRSSSGL